jgi:Sulfotransferase family
MPSQVREHDNNSMSSTRPPVFVVGMWRSGTSLFYALLNQHPQIKLMYEDELPLLWPLFMSAQAKADWPERWEFWNQALSRHKIDPDDLPRNASTLSEACEAAWKLYAPDATVRGCKSPNYFDCLPRLAQGFPHAKIIVLWRDPADVCRSVVRARTDSFFARRGMVLRALLGCRDLKRGYDALVAQGVRVHSLNYEDLVADPEFAMHGVSSFLEIPFDRRMISLANADRSAIYDASHHEGVNSEKIVPRKKAEVLSDRLRAKVARYTAYWKKESDGTFPHYPERIDNSPSSLFFVERFVDNFAYRILRKFDRIVSLIYCYVPIELLRKYRASKGRPTPEPASENRAEEKELVGASKH